MMNIYTHRLTLWTQLKDAEVADALDELHDITVKLDVDKTHAVSEARQRGYTWQEIGDRLGVSPQAAWSKWRYLDHSADE